MGDQKKKAISTSNLPPGKTYPIQNCRKVKTRYGEKLIFETENYIVYLPPRMNVISDESIKEINEGLISFEVVYKGKSPYSDLVFYESVIDEVKAEVDDGKDENKKQNIEKEETVNLRLESTKNIVEKKILKSNKLETKNVKEIIEDEANSDIEETIKN